MGGKETEFIYRRTFSSLLCVCVSKLFWRMSLYSNQIWLGYLKSIHMLCAVTQSASSCCVYVSCLSLNEAAVSSGVPSAHKHEHTALFSCSPTREVTHNTKEDSHERMWVDGAFCGWYGRPGRVVHNPKSAARPVRSHSFIFYGSCLRFMCMCLLYMHSTLLNPRLVAATSASTSFRKVSFKRK